MDKDQLRSLIERVLRDSGLYSESAVELLMLTAATESNLGQFIRQKGGGPALGIFQMEPSTYLDIWNNYIKYGKCKNIKYMYYEHGSANIEWDMKHAILMARVHYLRVSEPLPPADNIVALAGYWKKYYNTKLGKGTVDKAVSKYKRYVA